MTTAYTFKEKITVDGNLSLVLLGVLDAPEIFKIINSHRGYFRQWLPWVDGTQKVEDTKLFLKSCEDQINSGKAVHYKIIENEEIIGLIGTHAINKVNKQASIGYWTHPLHSGKGVMSRSCSALVEYLIKGVGIERVEIRAAVENLKSRRVIETIGAQFEGILRSNEWLNDRFVDHACYSILSKELK